MTILLIDDEPIVRDMVSEILEGEGHTVLCAVGGEQALAEFARSFRDIDAVLLDLSMPGLSGEQTFAGLRAIDPSVRVVVSSGYDREDAMRRFGTEGPAGFLQKPYRPIELLAELQRCLDC